MVTIWSLKAQMQLRKAFEYIYKDSPKNAQKVKDEIIELSISLVEHPERFPPDKYRINNDGCFRAFELHHYRVVYKIMEDCILVVRLRHTSMSPLEY